MAQVHVTIGGNIVAGLEGLRYLILLLAASLRSLFRCYSICVCRSASNQDW